MFNRIYGGCKIGNNKLFAFGECEDQDGDYASAAAIFCLKEDGTLQSGAYAGMHQPRDVCKILKLSDSKVLVVTQITGSSLMANIYSISGMSISVGSGYAFGGTGTSNNVSIALLSDSRVAIHYYQGGSSKITILSMNFSSNSLSLINTIDLGYSSTSIASTDGDKIWTNRISSDIYGYHCSVRCYLLVDTNIVQLDDYYTAESDEWVSVQRVSSRMISIPGNRILVQTHIYEGQDSNLEMDILAFENNKIVFLKGHTSSEYYGEAGSMINIDENKTIVNLAIGQSQDDYFFTYYHPIGGAAYLSDLATPLGGIIPAGSKEIVISNGSSLTFYEINSNKKWIVVYGHAGFRVKKISSENNYKYNGVAKRSGDQGELIAVHVNNTSSWQ